MTPDPPERWPSLMEYEARTRVLIAQNQLPVDGMLTRTKAIPARCRWCGGDSILVRYKGVSCPRCDLYPPTGS